MRPAAGSLAGAFTLSLIAAGLGFETVAARAPQPAAAWVANPVIEKRVIGRSVRGRPIVAYRLGQPGKRKAVAMAAMHGDERAPTQILTALVNGPRIRDIDLWVIPTYNPDGAVRGTRKNARGVDLNRNFPQRWVDLDGAYESGPRPASEPETRAVMRFLRAVQPRWIVSFHQPLHGIDTHTKNRQFAQRLVRHLRLPAKSFNCGGVCHGTLTMWYNARFPGAAVTVEYGAHPSRHRMRVEAPRQLIRALYARRG